MGKNHLGFQCNRAKGLNWRQTEGAYLKDRDSVMLPFSCLQSDIPIYGANSGGPVFDDEGRACAVNCTSCSASPGGRRSTRH